MSESQKLESIIRFLGVAEIRMAKRERISLWLLLLVGASTFRLLRSWYWFPVWTEIKGKDFQKMWKTSDRGDWLLWFCAHMIGQPGWPTHQQIVIASSKCARLALRHIKPGEGRPLAAIEAAEAWARGEATLNQARDAGCAANYIDHDDASYCAAQAAYSAAWAIYAVEDGACFRRAQAAAGAASWAASAAGYELFKAQLEARVFVSTADSSARDAAARQAVEKATLRQCAVLVRQSLTVPNSLTDELAALQE